jgi:citrate synthase
MGKWLTRAEALRELGVRLQTLYAYASRGQIRVSSDPNNPRRSLYRMEDIASLVAKRNRGRRPEAIAAGTIWLGEPIITTAISTIHRGRLYYRGRDAIQLSETATLEEAAAVLWDSPMAPRFDTIRLGPSGRSRLRARAFNAIADAAADGAPTLGLASSVLHEEAASLIGRLVSAFGASQGNEPVHVRLAKGWKLEPACVDLIRRALVLLIDQELTNSVFAARVAASTGACLGACMLAGFGAASGPLHGGASIRVQGLLKEIDRTSADEVVQRHLESGWPIPGFGHYMYPDGDPRASSLLAAFEPRARLKRTIAKVSASTGLAPTIDLALATLADRYKLPDDAPFSLFVIGRSVGWLAHSIEQVLANPGAMIRPRARYVGTPLQ